MVEPHGLREIPVDILDWRPLPQYLRPPRAIGTKRSRILTRQHAADDHRADRTVAGSRTSPSSNSAARPGPGAALSFSASRRAFSRYCGLLNTSASAARRPAGVQRVGDRRTPTPASTTRCALSGLSQVVGTTTSGTPARSAAMTVAGPPVVTTAAHLGSMSVWLSQFLTRMLGANSPRPSSSTLRWCPVVMITSIGRPARPCAAARKMNGSPYLNVLSVTCTHGYRLGIVLSHSAEDGSDGGCQIHGPTYWTLEGISRRP